MKRWSVRVLLALLVVLVLGGLGIWLYLRASLAQTEGRIGAAGLTGPVTVARDERGVPLISGARNDVAYATGFVHAQERFFQMDLLRRVGSGELAELFGERALARDRANRLHRFRARAASSLAAMTQAERLFLERYVAGVNAGLKALRAQPFEYAVLGATPRPWAAADSLLVVCAMYFDLQANTEPRELARGWLRESSNEAQLAFLLPEASSWDAPLDADAIEVTLAPIPPTPPYWWGKPRAKGSVSVASNAFIDSVGSNNWAVAGSRSTSGAAIVADDMHLGTNLPNTWYRLALQFPDPKGGTRRTVGVTLPGAPPIVVAGSNGRVAWGYTNSYADLMDLVRLGTDDAHPGQVLTPAGWETPTVTEETILVKGMAAHKMLVRETSVGPIREAGAKSYAVHWMAHAPQALNMQPLLMESVDTVDEALNLAATIGIPSQNFVAGDDKGNIGWTIAGLLPRRAGGALEASFPLAVGGPAPTFDANLAPGDYPRLVNPAAGQLSTANSRQLGGAGAAVIGDGGFDLGARNRQIRGALTALGAKTDVAAVYGVALDDRALFMETWRARAIKALDAGALDKQPRRAQFLALLQTGWTGRASVDSVGYRLARDFMWGVYDLLYDGANGELARLHPKATAMLASSRWPMVVGRLLDEAPAAWLPKAHGSWQALQLAAIDKVINDLTADGKLLAQASWGKRNTAAITHPIGVALPLLRPFLAAPDDMLPGDAHMPRVAGNNFGQSERMTVSPGQEDQGVFNMPGGQSGHPLSPYFLYGHADWVKGTATPLLPGPAKKTLTFVTGVTGETGVTGVK